MSDIYRVTVLFRVSVVLHCSLVSCVTYLALRLSYKFLPDIPEHFQPDSFHIGQVLGKFSLLDLPVGTKSRHSSLRDRAPRALSAYKIEETCRPFLSKRPVGLGQERIPRTP